MNNLEKRSVAALASVYAMRMLGLFMVLPVFVLLGTDLQGATPALLGMAIGAYGLTQALLQIPFGFLSDRYGRKPLIYAGLVVFACGSLLAGFSDHIFGVIAGRALQGAGAIASVLMALASDLTREEHRTKAMAAIGMSIGVAFSVSLVLGPLLGEWVGLSGLFFITGGLALVAMLLVAKLVPTPAKTLLNADQRPVPERFREVLRSDRLLRLDFGIFALHLTLTAIFIMVPMLLADQVGLPASSHWWFYLSVMLLSFVAMVPFIILAETRRKMKPVLCAAVLLLFLGMASLDWVGTSLGFAWGAMFVFFMAFNLLEATLPSLVSKESPAGSRGTAMGVYSTSQFLGAFLGGVLGGAVFGYFGIDGLILMLSVVLLAWLMVAVTMPTPEYTSSFVLQLSDSDKIQASSADAILRSLPGVTDVVIIQETLTAYLKIDRQNFDEQRLREAGFLQSPASD